jgi:hypothetical protein
MSLERGREPCKRMVFVKKWGCCLTPATVENPGLLDINLELETERGPAGLPNLFAKEAEDKVIRPKNLLTLVTGQ